MSKTEAGPVAQDWLKARIDEEMAEYSAGAYADHGGASDQLALFAADLMLAAHPPAQEQQSAISPKDCVWARNGHQVCPSAAPAQEQPAPGGMPNGYEAMTTCYKRYVSPAQYAAFSPGVQKWYRPFWTATHPAPAERAEPGCRSPAQDLMLCPNSACGWMGRCLAAEPFQPAERAEQPPRDAVQQGLTDEQIDALWRQATSADGFTTAQFVREFARAIERATLKGQP
jgi:hypothetical protein